MPFTSTPTRAELRASLAQRLFDPDNVHWTVAEKNAILNDALRTWNCLAFYYRVRGIFPTVANQAYYNLPSLLTNASELVLEQTVTSQDVCSALEYHLIEPQTTNYSSAWTGTEQFNFESITDAIQKARDEWLMQTVAQVEELALFVVTAGNGRVAVSNHSTADIRRVAWRSIDGDYSNLWRTDEQTLNRRLTDWNLSADTPVTYSIVTTPETTIQLAPTPIDNGQLSVLAIKTAPIVDLTTNSLIGIPDDFTPYLHWMSLCYLLSRDGPAYDDPRAQYAMMRLKEGIELGKLFSTSIQVLVNESAVPVDSLERFDLRLPDWQNASGQPVACAQAAPNLLAFYPVPDGIYSISVDTIRNAVLMTDDGNAVQLPEDVIGVYLDYCQHVAMFKSGGQDFLATMPYYKRFMEAAAGYNNLLRANARNFDILASQAQKERIERPAEMAA